MLNFPGLFCCRLEDQISFCAVNRKLTCNRISNLPIWALRILASFFSCLFLSLYLCIIASLYHHIFYLCVFALLYLCICVFLISVFLQLCFYDPVYLCINRFCIFASLYLCIFVIWSLYFCISVSLRVWSLYPLFKLSLYQSREGGFCDLL